LGLLSRVKGKDKDVPLSEHRQVLKAKAIVFSTDYTAEIKEAGINTNGKMIVEGHEFELDKIKPVLIEEKVEGGAIKKLLSKNKLVPYYFLKYDTVLPMMTKTVTTDTKYNISCPKCEHLIATWPAIRKTIEPLDMKSYKTLLPPDIMKETIELRFLKILKRYADRSEKTTVGRSAIFKIVLAVVGGVVIWLILMYLGILK
jgi:hypothetical protein